MSFVWISLFIIFLLAGWKGLGSSWVGLRASWEELWASWEGLKVIKRHDTIVNSRKSVIISFVDEGFSVRFIAVVRHYGGYQGWLKSGCNSQRASWEGLGTSQEGLSLLGGPQSLLRGPQIQLGGPRSQPKGLHNQLVGPQSHLRGLQSQLRGPQSWLRGPKSYQRGPQRQMFCPLGAEVGFKKEIIWADKSMMMKNNIIIFQIA